MRNYAPDDFVDVRGRPEDVAKKMTAITAQYDYTIMSTHVMNGADLVYMLKIKRKKKLAGGEVMES
jgi:hypothetical protein